MKSVLAKHKSPPKQENELHWQIFFAKSCVNGIYPHYNLITITRALSLQTIPKKHTIFFAPVNFIFPSYSDRKTKKNIFICESSDCDYESGTPRFVGHTLERPPRLFWKEQGNRTGDSLMLSHILCGGKCVLVSVSQSLLFHLFGWLAWPQHPRLLSHLSPPFPFHNNNC